MIPQSPSTRGSLHLSASTQRDLGMNDTTKDSLVKGDYPRALKDDFVSDDYLCDLLDIGKSATATMRRNGRGPQWFRLNGRPYYKISDIKAWIESNRVVTAA